MSEVESSELSARLHEIVDDHPIAVPDLLTPARSRRTRRRVLGGTAAVALVVAGALAATALLSATPRTALVAATPSPTLAPSTNPSVTPSAAILSNDTIAARCAPQMVKYDALPQLPGIPKQPGRTNTWRVAHQAHPYRVGDIVAMVPGASDYTAYCRIPAAGQESVNVSFVDLEAASLTTPDRVAMCSESMSILDRPTPTTASADFPSPDLRDATIVATASAGNTMALLLSQGTTTYSCILYPQPWVDGGVHMGAMDGTRALRVGFSGFATDAADTSVVPILGTYYYSAGRLPTNARTIEFTISKKVVATVTANADGWWVAAFMVAGRNAFAEPSTYAIKDAAGTVLKTAGFGG
jgi:hypothetical protein